MATVVIIGGGHVFRIEVHCSNQPNKSKLSCIAITFTLTFLINSCTQAARWGHMHIEVFERRAGLSYRSTTLCY